MARLRRMTLPQIAETRANVRAAREVAFVQNSIVIGRILQGLAALHLGDMAPDASTSE